MLYALAEEKYNMKAKQKCAIFMRYVDMTAFLQALYKCC